MPDQISIETVKFELNSLKEFTNMGVLLHELFGSTQDKAVASALRLVIDEIDKTTDRIVNA